MASFVPCLCWVGKGIAKEVPDKVQLTKEEIEELLLGTRQHLKDCKDSTEEEEDVNPLQLKKKATRQLRKEKQVEGGSTSAVPGKGGGGEMEDVEELYDLASYDGQEEGEEEEEGHVESLGCGFAGLTVFASNEDDPYISLKEVESSDEEEDFRVYPTDNLICVGKADQDYSSVEVHVYSERDDHSYCHHEVLLSAFPLALEWLDFDPDDPEQRGNLLAIGSMGPVIEVWDLDLVDGLEPAFVLGKREAVKGKGKKKSKKASKKQGKKEEKKLKDEGVEGHSDAVLGLSWNKLMRNVMASASADCSVRVWNLQERKTLLLLPHPDKVQCLEWHPYQPQTLLTGCYDRCVRLFDCQTPSDPQVWRLSGEVEKVVWNHLQPETFLASTEDGVVVGLARDSAAVLFTIKAHDQAVSDLCLSCYIPGLLMTVSADKSMKVWDIHDNKPAFLWAKDLKMGAIFTAKSCPDSPLLLAVGGEKDGLRPINLEKVADVREHFKGRTLVQPMSSREGTGQVEDVEGDVAMETTEEQAVPLTSVQSSSSSKAPFKRTKKKGKGKGKRALL